MARKSKLLTALDVHQGRDHQAEKQKKQRKQAEKRAKSKNADAEEWEDEDQSGDDTVQPLEALAEVCRFRNRRRSELIYCTEHNSRK